jgi:hypothetical protein
MLFQAFRPRTTSQIKKVTSSERSASKIRRIKNGLGRGVEEPVPSIAEGTSAMLVGRCSSRLSAHKSQPPTGAKRSGEPALSEVEWGPAVPSTSTQLNRKLRCSSGAQRLKDLSRYSLSRPYRYPRRFERCGRDTQLCPNRAPALNPVQRPARGNLRPRVGNPPLGLRAATWSGRGGAV